MKKDYEMKATQYAEKFGIRNYTVRGSRMTYRECYPNEGTYKATVNLITMEEKRVLLKYKYNC